MFLAQQVLSKVPSCDSEKGKSDIDEFLKLKAGTNILTQFEKAGFNEESFYEQIKDIIYTMGINTNVKKDSFALMAKKANKELRDFTEECKEGIKEDVTQTLKTKMDNCEINVSKIFIACQKAFKAKREQLWTEYKRRAFDYYKNKN